MKFTKMHGLGNDFVIIDNRMGEYRDYSSIAKKLCERSVSIGADGVMFLEKSDKADMKMVIYNSDGSYAEMCGNGIRCFAYYIYSKGIIGSSKMIIETGDGLKDAEVVKDDKSSDTGIVRISMGKAVTDKEKLNFNGYENNMYYEKIIGNRKFNCSTLELGVPHTILYVDKVLTEEVLSYGKLIERDSDYPKGTNANFVKVINKDEFEIRTFERGAGMTFACGTGTCAAAKACFVNGFTSNRVTAHLVYGDMYITVRDDGIIMEGPAKIVFEGEILK